MCIGNGRRIGIACLVADDVGVREASEGGDLTEDLGEQLRVAVFQDDLLDRVLAAVQLVFGSRQNGMRGIYRQLALSFEIIKQSAVL